MSVSRGKNQSIRHGIHSLQWRHNGHDVVSNHQRFDLFRRRSKKTPKLCDTGLCEGNSPVTSEFPSQRVSNADNASIRLDVTRLLKISHAHLRSSIAVTYRSAPSRMRIREFSLDTRLTVWRTLVENVRLTTFLWDKHVCHRNIHSWHILRCNTRLE